MAYYSGALNSDTLGPAISFVGVEVVLFLIRGSKCTGKEFPLQSYRCHLASFFQDYTHREPRLEVNVISLTEGPLRRFVTSTVYSHADHDIMQK